MAQILIYGVPDVGKTTLSKLLHAKTGIPLVEGDYIKTPYPATKFAWRKYGPLTKENAVKGLHYVREYMDRYVDETLAKHQTLILESVFINPIKYHTTATMFLVVSPAEAMHRKQFFAHREETNESIENFKAIRMIQEYLLEEARWLNVVVVRNDDAPEIVIRQFLDSL